MAITTKNKSVMNTLRRKVVGSIEKFFYWYGFRIAQKPWVFIGVCMLIAVISSLGLLRFKHEKNPLNLWVPKESDFKKDTEWIMNTFEEGYRPEVFLVTAPNVLEPSVLLEVERLRRKVLSVTVKNNTYEDVCFRIPAVKADSLNFFDLWGRRKKRSFFFFGRDDSSQIGGLQFDPSLYLSTGSYCNLVNNLNKVCLEINLPQIWSNNLNELEQLTLQDVIEKVNKTSLSPVTGHPVSYPELLGNVTRDENGKIIGATALLTIVTTNVNFSLVDWAKVGNAAGTNDWATESVLEWEDKLISVLENEAKVLKDNSSSDLSLYFESAKSFGDISGKSMFQDMDHIFIGSILMFIFVQLVLPARFNRVEMRLWLTVVGLTCVLLSFVIAVSLCSLLGVSYGPVHTSLPFLMLGIGVDDMFIITSCWINLLPSEKMLSHNEQIATTLKHAGLSISVTSVTDFMAFLVGSFTILPCLKSFCIYTAVGILVMYVFQATMFVAFLSLDAQRMRSGGNCIFWCIKHKDYQPAELSAETRQAKIFGAIYDKFILTKPVKIFLCMLTVGLAAVGIRGNLFLTQRFEPEWFLPNSSYLMQYITQRRIYFPDLGMDGMLVIGEANYSSNFPVIHNLTLAMESEKEILKIVDSWTHGFIKYSKKAEKIDIVNDLVSDADFNRLLSSYLWSPGGARFQKNFKFDGKLNCGQPAPAIVMSSIDFIYRKFEGPEQYLPAMNKLKMTVHDADLPRAAVWAKIYANWVTDEVIHRELYRNVGLALISVMFCTAFLIADLQTCVWIFVCVLLTLVDVSGFMYYWSMHIDVATCIALVLAVGLCVDFAAHIGHTFLRLTGSRHERAVNTVKYIGTATLNGGFSSLLSISLLSFSDAYIFKTFFKVFLLVVVFGLFHGVVFLPIIFSTIGPDSYSEDSPKTPIMKEMVPLQEESVHQTEHFNKKDSNGSKYEKDASSN